MERPAGYPGDGGRCVDIVEIGNGGGSIAWVDDYGKLHVGGPQSAGASFRRPAAYGMGGTDATTTDANLWLGRINRDYFCGGEMIADMDAVEDCAARPGRAVGAWPGPGGGRHREDREQQHGQRSQAGVVEPGLRPPGLHARRLRRRRRHARGCAGTRVGRLQGGDTRRCGRVFRLGNDDVRPAARLHRDAAGGLRCRERGRDREYPRRDRGRGTGAVRKRRYRSRTPVVQEVRQVPLPEPGAHDRGGAWRWCRDGNSNCGNQERVRSRVRARVHLPPRCPPWKWSGFMSRPRHRWGACRSSAGNSAPRAPSMHTNRRARSISRRTGSCSLQSTTATGCCPGCVFAARQSSKTREASTIVVHEGNEVDVDGFGNVVIDIHSQGARS